MGLGQGSDVEVSGVTDIEMELMRMYLQLVLAGLSLRGWVQKIDCENLEYMY